MDYKELYEKTITMGMDMMSKYQAKIEEAHDRNDKQMASMYTNMLIGIRDFITMSNRLELEMRIKKGNS